MNWERIRIGAELGFDPLDELEARLETQDVLELDPDTPGGAAVQVWAESGFSTDEATLTAMLDVALSKSRSEAVQHMSKGGQIVGSGATAFCSATPAAPAAPLCGLIGTGVGAVLGALGSLYEEIAGVNKAEARINLWTGVVRTQKLVLELQCSLARTWYALYGSPLDFDDSTLLLKKALTQLGYHDTAKNLRQVDGLGTIYNLNRNLGAAPCPDVSSSATVEEMIADARGRGKDVDKYVSALPLNMWIYYPSFTIRSGSIFVDADSLLDSSKWCEHKDVCRSRLDGVRRQAQQILEAGALVTAAFINMADEHNGEKAAPGTGIRSTGKTRKSKPPAKNSGGALVVVTLVAGLGIGMLLLKGIR